LPGDDEEDMRDDRDALFGHSVEDPINVEDPPAWGDDDGNSDKRTRPLPLLFGTILRSSTR
jgi:hypothetical protein